MDQGIALTLRIGVVETVGTRAAMCLGAKGTVRVWSGDLEECLRLEYQGRSRFAADCTRRFL